MRGYNWSTATDMDAAKFRSQSFQRCDGCGRQAKFSRRGWWQVQYAGGSYGWLNAQAGQGMAQHILCPSCAKREGIERGYDITSKRGATNG